LQVRPPIHWLKLTPTTGRDLEQWAEKYSWWLNGIRSGAVTVWEW
jgi:hypothetical protein